jgi:alpha/beta superfamily hydrolase
MDNKVVTTLGRACNDCGVPAVRFNFRGVGSSAGSYDEGRGEILDALAVCDFALSRWPTRSLILCGFSFGGYIAYEVALKRQAQLLITVAPAVTRFAMSDTQPDCRWLLVQGDQDEVVDPKAVLDWARSLGRPPTLKVLSGVGHFFHGRLHDLREVATEAVRNG